MQFRSEELVVYKANDKFEQMTMFPFFPFVKQPHILSLTFPPHQPRTPQSGSMIERFLREAVEFLEYIIAAL
jgi:Mrp family chromosome partitioning ATPase